MGGGAITDFKNKGRGNKSWFEGRSNPGGNYAVCTMLNLFKDTIVSEYETCTNVV